MAALLAACVAPLSLDGPSVAELPAPIPDWIAIRATEADDGRMIELPRAASIAVALRAPAQSGAGWVVTEAPAVLAATGRFSGPGWPPGAPDSRLAPAPLWQVFVFEARAPGAGRLRFELRGAQDDVPQRPRRMTLEIVVPPG